MTPCFLTILGDRVEINWNLVMSNAIGGAITGIIVGTILLVWNHSFNRFVAVMKNGKSKKDETDK